MMDSVRILKELGFTLYASMGTADFYQDHRIDVSGLQCCALQELFTNEANLYQINKWLLFSSMFV